MVLAVQVPRRNALDPSGDSLLKILAEESLAFLGLEAVQELALIELQLSCEILEVLSCDVLRSAFEESEESVMDLKKAIELAKNASRENNLVIDLGYKA